MTYIFILLQRFAILRFVKSLGISASSLRRPLLELWGMVVIACLVGFMGPFGTYAEGDLMERVSRWACFLGGAYVLVRPAIGLGRVLAVQTGLPETQVLIAGTVISSLPVAAIWNWGSIAIFGRELHNPVVLSFALVCALAVLVVVWWAEGIDDAFERRHNQRLWSGGAEARNWAPAGASPLPSPQHAPAAPRLLARLGTGFVGPVIALQSEDHYVRVHGPGHSKLVLMRLRDAIAEMDGVAGQQVHRSWWVAKAAMRGCERVGRGYRLHLASGLVAPVARDLVHELGEIAPVEARG